MASIGNDKFGNSASLDITTQWAMGYPVSINGKQTSGALVDLYLENGSWVGTNRIGNKYCWNNSSWVYKGKGTVTANINEYQQPVTPSDGNVLNESARIAQQQTQFVPGDAPSSWRGSGGAVPIETGLGGSITFGDQPTELMKYGLYLIGAVVAVVYFMRPKKRRR